MFARVLLGQCADMAHLDDAPQEEPEEPTPADAAPLTAEQRAKIWKVLHPAREAMSAKLRKAAEQGG